MQAFVAHAESQGEIAELETQILDWSRYLPDAIRSHEPPFTEDDHKTLLDLYFTYSAPWNLRVIKDYFLHDMRVALAGDVANAEVVHYSRALHNIILGEAALFAPVDSWIHKLYLRFVDEALQWRTDGSPVAVIQTHAALAHHFMATRGAQSEAARHYMEQAALLACTDGPHIHYAPVPLIAERIP